MMPDRAVAASPEPGRVLTKATRRAARSLGLSDAALAAVLGVSPSTVSRLGEDRPLDPASRVGECALLLLRVFRNLDSMLGDAESCRRWMTSPNQHLGAVPADLIRSIEGLVNVVRYLDAMRGKN